MIYTEITENNGKKSKISAVTAFVYFKFCLNTWLGFNITSTVDTNFRL